jgi:hypothetical protein
VRTFNKDKVRSVIILMAVVIGAFLVTSSGQAAGDTYYVAQNGNDENSCAAARDINAPKRNIMGNNGGIACMQSPGDTLLIRQGTYPEIINNYTAPYSLPSGTSWDNAFTVAAYPGETVVIQRIAIATDDHLNLELAYWIFDGLHVVNDVPGGTEAIWMGSPDHLRFVNMEATTAGRDSALCVQGDGHFIEFINVEVHSCGDPTAPVYSYGFYWGGSDSLFDQIKLHDTTGYGFHLYSKGCEADGMCPERNTIRNSEIYNTGTVSASAGILFAFGDGNQAHGNIIRHNSSGITVGYGASDAKIYDNKIYENGYNGISSGSGWGNSPSSNVVIENNIIASNGGYGILNSAEGVSHGEPIGTIIQNNTMFNNAMGVNGILDTGIGTTRSNNVTADVGL